MLIVYLFYKYIRLLITLPRRAFTVPSVRSSHHRHTHLPEVDPVVVVVVEGAVQVPRQLRLVNVLQ